MENIKIILSKLPKKINECIYLDFPKKKIEIGIIKLDNNKFKVFNSFCPHFGGRLNVKDGNFFCYFHEYKYNIEDGRCINRKIGSRCTLYEYKLTDKYLII